MSRVIDVPEVLDHRGFEQLVRYLPAAEDAAGARILGNNPRNRYLAPQGQLGLRVLLLRRQMERGLTVRAAATLPPATR